MAFLAEDYKEASAEGDAARTASKSTIGVDDNSGGADLRLCLWMVFSEVLAVLIHLRPIRTAS